MSQIKHETRKQIKNSFQLGPLMTFIYLISI